MKQKRTKPRPTLPKKVRERKTDWDLLEALDLQADYEARERKRRGPSPEAQKLLNKKPRGRI